MSLTMFFVIKHILTLDSELESTFKMYPIRFYDIVHCSSIYSSCTFLMKTDDDDWLYRQI